MREMCEAFKQELAGAEERGTIDPFSIAAKYSLEIRQWTSRRVVYGASLQSRLLPHHHCRLRIVAVCTVQCYHLCIVVAIYTCRCLYNLPCKYYSIFININMAIRLIFLYFRLKDYELLQLVDELGGKSASAVPQELSFLPNVSSKIPPSSQKLCVIQLFVYGLPFNVALWI